VKALTGQQSILAPGTASVLANVAYLNAISGQEIIRTTVQPTASGSGIIKLTPTAGALNVPGNQAIANAVRAATAPTYGMSNVSGGVTVFNVTPQGTSPTTTLTTPTAIASALARGLI
jgi:hypothetical protein